VSPAQREIVACENAVTKSASGHRFEENWSSRLACSNPKSENPKSELIFHALHLPDRLRMHRPRMVRAPQVPQRSCPFRILPPARKLVPALGTRGRPNDSPRLSKGGQRGGGCHGSAKPASNHELCRHFGPEVRREVCPSCRGHVELKYLHVPCIGVRAVGPTQRRSMLPVVCRLRSAHLTDLVPRPLPGNVMPSRLCLT